MKRSRIFLTVAAFAIAVVTVVATKANKFSPSYYYKDLSLTNPVCNSISATDACTIGSNNPCLYQGNSNYQEYYTNGTTACQFVLRYN